MPVLNKVQVVSLLKPYCSIINKAKAFAERVEDVTGKCFILNIITSKQKIP